LYKVPNNFKFNYNSTINSDLKEIDAKIRKWVIDVILSHLTILMCSSKSPLHGIRQATKSGATSATSEQQFLCTFSQQNAIVSLSKIL
jgi:hypothetical protein